MKGVNFFSGQHEFITSQSTLTFCKLKKIRGERGKKIKDNTKLPLVFALLWSMHVSIRFVNLNVKILF